MAPPPPPPSEERRNRVSSAHAAAARVSHSTSYRSGMFSGSLQVGHAFPSPSTLMEKRLSRVYGESPEAGARS